MTWLAVARLLARDARRSRAVWAVVGGFAVVALAASVLPAIVVGDELTADRALTFLVSPLELVVALTALLTGYGAIAGPRTGGQLKLVLGLPIDRTALVIGAFVGRVVVVLGGVAVGLGVVAAALPAVYGELPVRSFLTFGFLLALFAVSVTALAVGCSAAVRSRGRAAVAVVLAFGCFEFFWGVVPAGASYLVTGTLPGPTVPGWVVLVHRLQPFTAFEATAAAWLPSVGSSVQLSASGAQAAGPTMGGGLASRLTGPTPFYLDPWAGLVTLLGWTVVPLVVGWHRFRRADL